MQNIFGIVEANRSSCKGPSSIAVPPETTVQFEARHSKVYKIILLMTLKQRKRIFVCSRYKIEAPLFVQGCHRWHRYTQ